LRALDRYAASVDLVAISEVSIVVHHGLEAATGGAAGGLGTDCRRNVRGSAGDYLPGRPEDIHGKPGIAASVFETVANAQVNIRMISQGASEINNQLCDSRE